MKLITPERRLENVLCFTTTREGGVSIAPFDSLNLAMHVTDDSHDVLHNRRILSDYLYDFQQDQLNRDQFASLQCSPLQTQTSLSDNIHALKFLQQTHSNVVINYADAVNACAPADAIYTAQRYTPLAVLSADCVPIVIVSTMNDECAVIHAGWKGLLSGIIENTVNTFRANNSALAAWIGPSICQQHFEVEAALAKIFHAYQPFICQGPDETKRHIDLAAMAHHALGRLGVHDVQQSHICTYCHEDLFSFRQATHMGLKECGRMATVVMKY